jgi:small acid-soluble spore protein H (minor)
MNKIRAIEISVSPAMENVTFQGTPVYIQHVYENDTVRVYPLDNREQEQIVPLESLVEQ